MKFFKKQLIFFLPLLFSLAVHFLFSYVIWDINPANWDIMARMFSSVFMVIACVVGVLISKNEL